MATQLHEVEFETRTIGPLVLTTPVLQRLEFREIVNRHCPIAEQAELDHGLVAELVTQSRLSDPCDTQKLDLVIYQTDRRTTQTLIPHHRFT